MLKPSTNGVCSRVPHNSKSYEQRSVTEAPLATYAIRDRGRGRIRPSLHLKNLGGFVLAGALTRSVIAPM